VNVFNIENNIFVAIVRKVWMYLILVFAVDYHRHYDTLYFFYEIAYVLHSRVFQCSPHRVSSSQTQCDSQMKKNKWGLL